MTCKKRIKIRLIKKQFYDCFTFALFLQILINERNIKQRDLFFFLIQFIYICLIKAYRNYFKQTSHSGINIYLGLINQEIINRIQTK